jgi:hypothetical protein
MVARYAPKYLRFVPKLLSSVGPTNPVAAHRSVSQFRAEDEHMNPELRLRSTANWARRLVANSKAPRIVSSLADPLQKMQPSECAYALGRS